MELEQEMNLKWAEIEEAKAKRQALFADEIGNRDQIGVQYYEINILELQYMLLKRKQLMELYDTSPYQVVRGSAENIASINEHCIRILRRELAKNGYQSRLEQLGLLLDELPSSVAEGNQAYSPALQELLAHLVVGDEVDETMVDHFRQDQHPTLCTRLVQFLGCPYSLVDGKETYATLSSNGKGRWTFIGFCHRGESIPVDQGY
jgi:hypothetical protein